MEYKDIESRLEEISEKTDYIRYSFESNNKGLRGKRGCPGPGGPSHDPKKGCISEIEIIIKDLQDIKMYINKNN